MTHTVTVSEPDSVLPSLPPSNVPAGEPARPSVPGARVGRAAGVHTRVEARGERSSRTVLAFRLVDPATGLPTEVELRGPSISGTVREGDWVEVAGTPGRSGRLEPGRVVNLTTRSEVSVAGVVRGPLAKALAVLLVLFFVGVLLALVFGLVAFFRFA